MKGSISPVTPCDRRSPFEQPNSNISGALQPSDISRSRIIGYFRDQRLESLYQAYARRVRKEFLVFMALLAVLFNVYGVIICVIHYTPGFLACSLLTSCSTAVSLLLLVFLVRPQTHLSSCNTKDSLLGYVLWGWLGLNLYVYMGLSTDIIAPDETLDWQLVYVFATCVAVPAALRPCVIMASAVIAFYTVLVVLLSTHAPTASLYRDTMPNTVCASLLLQLLSMTLGVARYLLMDRDLRVSFLDTRSSLGISLQLEQASREQKQLLLSVLPVHVADEMLRDIGSEDMGQFRKIYMKRHQNVSILFADIVGFTALSSTVTPKQLVRILNDLFATFDKLANKYGQLRIKILGDCYYSISGCPDPRPDHAVLTVHMGLSMVDAISEVREKTKSGVNMRVGIHTGAVLAGVLGQVRWQFDVLGKEVTLANHMESGGLPGRVHLSEATAACLNGEFELERGDGDTRDSTIKMAELKTYLIRGVNKPYPQGTLNDANVRQESRDQPSRQEKNPAELDNGGLVVDQNDRLYRALMDRAESTTKFPEVNSVTLRFNEATMETDFIRTTPRYPGVSLALLASVIMVHTMTMMILKERSLLTILTASSCFLCVALMIVITLARCAVRICSSGLERFAGWLDRNWLAGLLWTSLAVTLAIVSSCINMVPCRYAGQEFGWNTSQPVPGRWSSLLCQYPTYMSHLCVELAIGIIITVQINYIFHAFMLLGLAVIGCLQPALIVRDAFVFYDSVRHKHSNSRAISSVYADPVMIVTICLALVIICRQLDRLSRKLFFYRREVNEMRHQMSALRSKNESLIYNMLPSHVAKHFIGGNIHQDDLYSQSYDEVGIMFASCPNFNDFYTEDAVNNNGLEWFRFLNEILSDYDDLLKQPRFKSVVKIKTIGATLMAASGMESQANTDKPWQHLSALVGFGLAMKETLAKINTESFNNFQLRIGINCGAVLAGVIGTGKPHYDIWGNSVNVASRMESTGQMGKLQVVEDTMTILTEFGYKFERRGLVTVKGKGDLMTYFLTAGTPEASILPNQVVQL